MVLCRKSPGPSRKGLVSRTASPRVAAEVSLVLTPDSNWDGDKMGFALSAGGLWELLQVYTSRRRSAWGWERKDRVVGG